jgi:hypothetical protein
MVADPALPGARNVLLPAGVSPNGSPTKVNSRSNPRPWVAWPHTRREGFLVED